MGSTDMREWRGGQSGRGGICKVLSFLSSLSFLFSRSLPHLTSSLLSLSSELSS
jgi:hypothetical protein